MWLQILPLIVSGICALAAVYCALLARSAVIAARVAQARAESAARVPTSLQSAVQSLTESQSETADALQTLANRVKMMRVRNAANHVGEKSDPTSADDTLKDRLRRKAGLVAGQPAKHA